MPTEAEGAAAAALKTAGAGEEVGAAGVVAEGRGAAGVALKPNTPASCHLGTTRAGAAAE